MSGKIFKQLLCLLCAAAIAFGSFCVSAESGQGTITVDTVSAITGDTVIVKVSIENNPGIMAMTLSLTYDSNALTYEKFYRSSILRDYTVADHPEQNLIRFVNCENGNVRKNGTFVSFQFKVKDDASYDFHPISISYKAGDFCNWKLEKLMPEIVSGGVDVAFNGNNCRHSKYGAWSVVAEPACTEPGAKQRVCEKCGHIDIAEIAPVGHDFEENWTIDRPATAESDGVMTRHCKYCDAVTDTLTFSLEQSDRLDIGNNEGNTEIPSDFLDTLIKEQLPDGITESSRGESTDRDDNKQDNIIDSIREQIEDDSPTAKILDALPNQNFHLDRFGTLVLSALLFLLRLIII